VAKTVIVYTQPGWTFCGRAKEFLRQHGIPFEERDVTQNEAYYDELERLNVYSTPAILVDGEVVVGFNRKRLTELLGLPG